MKKIKRSLSSSLNPNNYIKNEILNYNIDNNCLLNIKARVIKSKLIHKNGYNADYIEYWIEIITDYKNWIIKKRYSEFYELNQKIIQKIPEIEKLFPPKRLFKNSENTVEERKIYFNKYLKFLFKTNNIFLFNEALDFIQIEKKIVELYLKKLKMVKQDQNNLIFQSLKKCFKRMCLKEKMEKSELLGEDLKIKRINIFNTKISSKEELNHGKDININKYERIIESTNDFYEIEELNKNYYSTLFDYENIKNIEQRAIHNKNNSYINYYKKYGGTVVIEEFLKNLSQDIDNKIDILTSFEEFLRQKWPKFSNFDIIKLYVGNINNTTISFDKKLNFDLNKLNKSNNNIEKITYNKSIKKSERKSSLINQKKIDIDKDDNISDDDNLILKGLFYYIGSFDNNFLLSSYCLDLLIKLLDSGFNPDIDIYLKIFKTRRISDYQSMKLEEIIKKNIEGIKAKKNALKLLSLLMEDKNKEIIKKTLIKDENVFNQLTFYNNMSDD